LSLELVTSKVKSVGYLTLFGLFKHENKLSVVHFNVQKLGNAENEENILKSKDVFLFQVKILYILFFYYCNL
jgi:hypothetical protein